MALADDEVESEYESDPEELKRSLARRRREASDDDDDGDNEVDGNPRAEIESDQSDEQISTVKYDNDEDVEEEEGGGVDDDKRVKEAGVIDGEEDKEKQQSTVPTGGPFYMHDDRFQETSSGGNRRMRGGRKPWGSGEERKWGHDKFEEMNTREKHYHQKTSRGRGRSHGRGRGQERGYTRGRGSSSNALSSNGQQIYLPKAITRGSSSNTSNSNGQQVYLPKSVTRGNGPRKLETPQGNGNNAHPEQIKQLQNSQGKMPHLDSQNSSTALSKTGNEGARAKKNVAASSLSSDSPPFYPSVPSSNLGHGIQAGMERIHVNESSITSGKKYRNTKSTFSPVYIAKTIQSTSQGGSAPATTGNAFYPQSHSQGDRFSSPMQLNGESNGTDQTCIRPSGQGFDQNSAVIRSLSSSPQKASSSKNRYPSGEKESVSETGVSITKGKGTLQPSGSSSVIYGGSQGMGRTESLASVMQFGGVPTFGMTYPGYVQPEHGVGNPEMAWMPVLTGPGALGATYSPPYAANQAHKPHLPSSAGSSSKENSTNNLNDLEDPVERHGIRR